MFTTLHLAFAGLAAMSLHFFLGSAACAVCVAIGLYAPFVRKDCFLLAFAILYGLGMEAIGIHDEKVRVAAQERVIEQSVDRAVKKTETPSAKKQSDPWDRRGY